MLKICRIFRFEAAHNLPFHKGKCFHIHGHSYKLEVEIGGDLQRSAPENNHEYGMVMDFGKLKEIVESTVIKKYDHQNLNDFFENPTAEIMVMKIFSDLEAAFLARNVYLRRLRLWETENSYAEWESDVYPLNL